MADPNFPTDLDIKPLLHASVAESLFGVQAQQDGIAAYGIAGRVWEAAYAMTAYLDPASTRAFDPLPFTRERDKPVGVVELGSGTGIVASSIAPFLGGGDVLVATDLPEVCPLLERNLLSDTTNVVVRPLAWGNKAHAESIQTLLDGKVTHIICSDLIYFPQLLAPLLRTLLHLTSNGGPTVIISYMIRSLTKESPFWSAFGLWFEYHPVADADGCFVFHAQRRPGSLTWPVPERDLDLLEGVGAQGTLTGKEDGTFELLLLYSMCP